MSILIVSSVICGVVIHCLADLIVAPFVQDMDRDRF